jgi:hypothetical protein
MSSSLPTNRWFGHWFASHFPRSVFDPSNGHRGCLLHRWPVTLTLQDPNPNSHPAFSGSNCADPCSMTSVTQRTLTPFTVWCYIESLPQARFALHTLPSLVAAILTGEAAKTGRNFFRDKPRRRHHCGTTFPRLVYCSVPSDTTRTQRLCCTPSRLPNFDAFLSCQRWLFRGTQRRFPLTLTARPVLQAPFCTTLACSGTRNCVYSERSRCQMHWRPEANVLPGPRNNDVPYIVSSEYGVFPSQFLEHCLRAPLPRDSRLRRQRHQSR